MCLKNCIIILNLLMLQFLVHNIKYRDTIYHIQLDFHNGLFVNTESINIDNSNFTRRY